MDELEGYLQCFDEKHRGTVIRHVREQLEYYQQHAAEKHLMPPLFQVVFTLALHDFDDAVLLHKLIDMCPKKDFRFWPEFHCICFDEKIQLVYDRGIRYVNVRKPAKLQIEQFLDCREHARNAAIAVLGCFFHGRSAKGACGAAVGEKDVGRIIGRAIWASRGIKEWLI